MELGVGQLLSRRVTTIVRLTRPSIQTVQQLANVGKAALFSPIQKLIGDPT